MDRKEFFRKNITKTMRGIEFGPSYSPLFPKKEGFNCISVDHACKKELVEKYEKWEVPTELIEEVDLIFDGTPIDQILTNNSFDYIVASHVFEHLPDPINFLNSMGKLLKEEGLLLLAIPDKRYCFDLLKPLTTPGLLIDSYLNKKKENSIGQKIDATLFACKRDNLIGFPGQTGFSNINPNNSCEHLIEDANNVIKNAEKGEFLDIHAWHFTPKSFISNLKILSKMRFIKSFEIIDLHSDGIFEFFCKIKKLNHNSKDKNLISESLLNYESDFFQLWLDSIKEENQTLFPQKIDNFSSENLPTTKKESSIYYLSKKLKISAYKSFLFKVKNKLRNLFYSYKNKFFK